MMGREREDLGRGLRSVAHGSYVIIFRYLDDRMQVVRIVHGRRDLPAVMKQDDEG
jgi:toxin ParE1/3/4